LRGDITLVSDEIDWYVGVGGSETITSCGIVDIIETVGGIGGVDATDDDVFKRRRAEGEISGSCS
jgi:hypothetical protein